MPTELWLVLERELQLPGRLRRSAQPVGAVMGLVPLSPAVLGPSPALAEIVSATKKEGLSIVTGPNGRPLSYCRAATEMLAVRRRIGADAYDLHALHYTAAAELAAAGCSDDLIMAVTGHGSLRMVAKYAGAVRQKARATEAQSRRNRTKTEREK